jgi:L-rhamnose mutarotase
MTYEPEVVVLHAVLRVGAEQEYARLHARIPEELAADFVDAGVTAWRIWQDGVHLVHLVTLADRAAFMVRLRESGVNRVWQDLVGPLTETAPRDMAPLWSLEQQLAIDRS